MNKYEKKYKDILEKQKNKKHVPLTSVIRAHCLECCGFYEKVVSSCSAKGECVLYPYRLGRNPFTKRAGNLNNLNLGTAEPESSNLNEK